MPLLGVNIDHIATLRQARRETEPDPVMAALLCEKAGADSIVAHLREDRRHINDNDVKRLRESLKGRLNLEMAANSGIVSIACRIRPDQATLVPERRQELTTEGGLDVVRQKARLKMVCRRLSDEGIAVSLFIDPDKAQLEAARELVAIVEFHTGAYAGVKTTAGRAKELRALTQMTAYGRKLGLTVNAGHGLKYHNTTPVAKIPGMHELNIGHSIISRAVVVGIEVAVREMVELCKV